MSRREAPFVQIATLVRDLCQLRRGPEEMPYSKRLFATLVGASIALDIASGIALGEPSHVLGRSLVSTGLVLALCGIALGIRGLGNRYVQTASALVACSMFFSLLVLPLAWLAGPTPSPPAQLSPTQVLIGWAVLAIVLWSLLVAAHIIRRALDAPFVFGFALALAWALADWALGSALFDAAG